MLFLFACCLFFGEGLELPYVVGVSLEVSLVGCVRPLKVPVVFFPCIISKTGKHLLRYRGVLHPVFFLRVVT